MWQMIQYSCASEETSTTASLVFRRIWYHWDHIYLGRTKLSVRCWWITLIGYLLDPWTAAVLIYIYIYKITNIHIDIAISLSLYIYIYIYIHVCMCMYVCIYIYIYTYMYTHIYTSLSLYIYIYAQCNKHHKLYDIEHAHIIHDSILHQHIVTYIQLYYGQSPD